MPAVVDPVEEGFDAQAKQDFATSELDPMGDTMSTESMLAEKAQQEGRVPPMKDNVTLNALDGFGPTPPLEILYPAKANGIKLARQAGLRDELIKGHIDRQWKDLNLAGFDDAKVSEMFQGKRPFPPAIDMAHPERIDATMLEQFKASNAPSGVEEAQSWSLHENLFKQAKQMTGIAEIAISGMTMGLVTPKMLEQSAAGPFEGYLPEKPLAETALNPTQKAIAQFLGSGIGVVAMAGTEGIIALSEKATSEGLKQAIKWGGATFVYDAMSQLLEKGKIDIGELFDNTGMAALGAGVLGNLAGLGKAAGDLSSGARTKLAELVSKKAKGGGEAGAEGVGGGPPEGGPPSGPKVSPDQTAHLERAGKEAEAATKPLPTKTKMALVDPEIAKRETILLAYRKLHPEVPEGHNMSNMEMTKALGASMDRRQLFGNTNNALWGDAADIGYQPAIGTNPGTKEPIWALAGKSFKRFGSEQEMLDWIKIQPRMQHAPVHGKPMTDVLEGNMDVDTRIAIDRQKVHAQSGFNQTTKDPPGRWGSWAGGVSENQLVKPYPDVVDEHTAMRTLQAIQDQGMGGFRFPNGSGWSVVAHKPGSGEAVAMAQLYIKSLQHGAKPNGVGMFGGLPKPDYIKMRIATGNPLPPDELKWFAGVRPSIEQRTGMSAIKGSAHMQASRQMDQLFGALPEYFKTKGIEGAAAKKITKTLSTALGKGLSDARTIQVRIDKALAEYDAKRIAGGQEPIARDLIALSQRSPER
jgi:hypothetical protein